MSRVCIIVVLFWGATAFAETPPVNTGPENDYLVVYQNVTINRSVDVVWPELMNFVSWYFTVYGGGHVKFIKGKVGEEGYTLEANNTTRHVLISIRNKQSIVWKTCLIISCSEDYVFSDHSLETVAGKTKLTSRNYSQGFWPEDYIKKFRQRAPSKPQPEEGEALVSFKNHIENIPR